MLARQRGAYRGRKPTLSDAQVADVRRRVEAGERKAQIARDYGISRETLSQYLRSPR
ncbi:helix-turn-helix domain-containing protein [Burkholderia sp. RF7-non_BP4]|uniref:helix-turn-helix domain-containing protein n=1 Tax=Burkholderia sp. RF7-non_BP4 TaxID=1637848 RepID=UPI003F88D1BF